MPKKNSGSGLLIVAVLVAVVIIGIVSLKAQGSTLELAPSTAARGIYMVLADSGGVYGLAGADNVLNGLSLQNGTTRISVTGWVWSGYASSSGHVPSNFLGNIYAETYTINGVTYTVPQSTVTATTTIFSQGTQTMTSGQPYPGQVVTTTYTGYYGLMTVQLRGQVTTVNGLLAWTPPVYVCPASGCWPVTLSRGTLTAAMITCPIGYVALSNGVEWYCQAPGALTSSTTESVVASLSCVNGVCSTITLASTANLSN